MTEVGYEVAMGTVTNQVIQDLVPDDADHLEGLLRGHGVDQDVAVQTDVVLRVEDAVFILSRSRDTWAVNQSMRLWAHVGVWGGAGRSWVPYLPCRVYDLRRKVLALVFDHATERVLDGGVVALDEVAVHKLHGQG